MKIDKVIKVLKGVLFVFIALLSILITGTLLAKVDPANTSECYHEYPKYAALNEDRSYYIDSLQDVHQGKLSVEKYRAATLIALSRYPELKHANISVELSNSGAPMESSFKYLSLLRSARNRKYVIYLYEGDSSSFDPILMKNLPFDAQVGIIAHELGHTAYYHDLNVFQILKWAVLYSIDIDFRATHERTTDLIPVYRGLGSQIYDYAEYVRTSPATVDFYEMGKSFMDKFYLTHHEIRDEMIKLGY